MLDYANEIAPNYSFPNSICISKFRLKKVSFPSCPLPTFNQDRRANEIQEWTFFNDLAFQFSFMNMLAVASCFLGTRKDYWFRRYTGLHPLQFPPRALLWSHKNYHSEILEHGKGTDDHLLPLGDRFHSLSFLCLPFLLAKLEVRMEYDSLSIFAHKSFLRCPYMNSQEWIWLRPSLIFIESDTWIVLSIFS